MPLKFIESLMVPNSKILETDDLQYHIIDTVRAFKALKCRNLSCKGKVQEMRCLQLHFEGCLVVGKLSGSCSPCSISG